MEVIIIVFTAIIQNDPEMKQELETFIFSTPFLFMSIFIFPSLDADPFIHISEGSRLHLSFRHQHLPLATKLWPEVPGSPSHHVIPPRSLTPSKIRQIDPPSPPIRRPNESESKFHLCVVVIRGGLGFGFAVFPVWLSDVASMHPSPVEPHLPGLGRRRGTGVSAGRPQSRAGPSAAGLAGSRPAHARSRLCARASYVMETSRSRSGRVTSYLILWQCKNILTNTAFLHTEG